MINGNGFYSEIAIEIIRLFNQNNEMSWFFFEKQIYYI